MKHLHKLFLPALFSVLFVFSNLAQETGVEINSVRIWDQANHNAFTDLVRYRGHFYCVFREGAGHVPSGKEENGNIRILKSRKGNKWKSAGLLSSEMYDLRDPKISVMPDGRLMVLMGGSDYVGKELRSRLCQVSFSNNGKEFSDPAPVEIDHRIRTNYDWIWKITWKGEKGYGLVYQPVPGRDWTIALVSTTDGINYNLVKAIELEGKPNESTVRFKDDTMYAMVRREAGANGLLGISKPPYNDWQWIDLGMRIGGPEFLITDDGYLICGTRSYPRQESIEGYKTVIIKFDKRGKELKRIIMPSGGDTSYPGMVIYRRKLWISYYSSHEGKTSIYFASLSLDLI
jgi:hypothetical protein